MDEENIKLLPCPFCGKTPQQPKCYATGESSDGSGVAIASTCVFCTNCFATGSPVEVDEIVEDDHLPAQWHVDAAGAWNKRSNVQGACAGQKMNEEHDSVTSRIYKENWDDAVQLLNKQNELISKLRKGLDAADALMRESRGVAGLHLNGDLATWDELRTGGRFEEWLIDFDAALTPNVEVTGKPPSGAAGAR